jgi:hypothetical protein
MEFPTDLAVAIFEVVVPLAGFIVGDRILVRPTAQGPVYELYRRLRSEDVEEVLTPKTAALTATEPGGAFAEAARLFARSPSSQPELRRLK